MAKREPLHDDQLEAALGKLPGWKLAEGKLFRDCQFADFTHAYGGHRG